jgi:hypothetical protein
MAVADRSNTSRRLMKRQERRLMVGVQGGESGDGEAGGSGGGMNPRFNPLL